MPNSNVFAFPSGQPIESEGSIAITFGEGFTVSYNNCDAEEFGGQSTALVLGQDQAFYILNGDHRAAYAELMDSGFGACLIYFQANLASINKYSDRISKCPATPTPGFHSEAS